MKIRSSITSQILLFSCTLLTAASLNAGESTDVIVMKNGDHLTGKVKSVDRGVLFVSLDYVDGTISVDWSESNPLREQSALRRTHPRRIFI